jgi:hypothetical protein
MTSYKELISTIKAELKHEVACKQWDRRYDAIYKMPEEQREAIRAKLDACKPENFYICYSQTWRAKHIAYCMLRGRTIEQIEPGRNPNRASDHKQADYYAARYLKDWREEAAEDIAAWEAKKAEKLATKEAE